MHPTDRSRPTDETPWQTWLETRRQEQPPEGLADDVMRGIHEPPPVTTASPRLLAWVEAQGWRQCAACVAAALIGSLPFLFFAITVFKL